MNLDFRDISQESFVFMFVCFLLVFLNPRLSHKFLLDLLYRYYFLVRCISDYQLTGLDSGDRSAINHILTAID